jgi:opacity protein-like surface antigen
MKNLLAAAMLAVLFSAGAQAQMVTAQNPASLVGALQGAGYRAELTKDSQGDPMINSASSGSNFVVYFYGCTNNIDCKTIQFMSSYKTEKIPELSLINDWNRRKRFARAWIENNGKTYLAMDVDIDDGGISSKLFEDNLEFWVSLMASFEKHIGL